MKKKNHQKNNKTLFFSKLFMVRRFSGAVASGASHPPCPISSSCTCGIIFLFWSKRTSLWAADLFSSFWFQTLLRRRRRMWAQQHDRDAKKKSNEDLCFPHVNVRACRVNRCRQSSHCSCPTLFPTDNLVVAIYSYEPKHDGDLGFEKGDKLKILNQ